MGRLLPCSTVPPKDTDRNTEETPCSSARCCSPPLRPSPATLAAPAAHAEWPDRPIHFIVGFGPGGANDLIARFAAEGVGKELEADRGHRKPARRRRGDRHGLSSRMRQPDGYTFLVGAASTITNSLLLKDLPYKDSDLVPVGMIAVAPSTIIVNPSVPASNMKEFIAWAKAQGGKAHLVDRRQRQHAGIRRRDDQGGDRRLVQHRPVQERRRRRERRDGEQRVGDLGGEHRRGAEDQGRIAEGDRHDLRQTHQRLSVDPDHGGAGLSDRADRPLGRALCAGAARRSRSSRR